MASAARLILGIGVAVLLLLPPAWAGLQAWPPATTGAPGAQQAPPPPNGFQRCGPSNVVLVFLNPDLKPAGDGFIHASGTFFIQFQARGEDALKIEKFTFSFGEALPDGVSVCNTPLDGTAVGPVTGAYIKDYRCDNDPKDGFFVPIDTYNVPDGSYGAAVSAYDKDGNELVRYYTKAKVENGGRQTPNDPRDPKSDKIEPWPMILPGDGDLTGIEKQAAGAGGLYIEVAENVSGIEAFLNGALLQLKNVTAPARDDDVVPCTPLGEGQVTNHPWGPAWTWDGIVNQEDVVKVRILDLNGNIAEKVVHIGDPTIGGRVVGTNPEVEIAVDNAEQTSDDNGTAVWHVTYKTLNDAGLHADLFLQTKEGKPLPPGLESRLRPNHVMMGGNQELQGTVQVTGTENATLGGYDLKLVADYLSGDQRLQKTKDLRFTLTAHAGAVNDTIASKAGVEAERTGGTDANLTKTNTTAPPAEPKKSPGAEPALLVAGTALLAAAARRRVRAR